MQDENNQNEQTHKQEGCGKAGCGHGHHHAHHNHDHSHGEDETSPDQGMMKKGCCGGGCGRGESDNQGCATDLPQVDVDALPIGAQQMLKEMAKNAEYMQGELDKTYESYIRVIAEMENVKRRAQMDIESRSKMAIQGFTKDLLPVLDAMDALLKTSDKLDAGTREGFTLLHQSFLKAFEKNGAKRIATEGEVNPHLHQVVSTEKSDKPAGHIVHELQAGYVLGDIVLRPAMVSASEK